MGKRPRGTTGSTQVNMLASLIQHLLSISDVFILKSNKTKILNNNSKQWQVVDRHLNMQIQNP